MARKRIEKNPVRRARLIQLMEENDISQNELSRRTGIAQQNISRICSESDNLNLSETNAGAIVAAFPEYRIQWLLGYDNFKTSAELVMSLISDGKERRTRKQALFAVMAEMNGWKIEDNESVLAIDLEGLPIAFSDADFEFEHYATIAKDEKTVTLNQNEFELFVQKMLDYFEFELSHMTKANPAQ